VAVRDKIMQSFFMKLLAVSIAVFIPSLVMAHAGHDSTTMSMGILSGALHPLLGLDHLLSLIAVGVLCSRLNGKQKYLVPLSFVGLMLAGFMFTHAGQHLVSVATIEMLIAASLIMAAVFVVLGKVLQKSSRFHHIAAWSVTAFASVHGMAHGLEIPAGASAMGFATGFAIACLIVLAAAYHVSRSVKAIWVQATA
jgi:urease accessory protein